MNCFILKTHDPHFNLALEEVLLKNRKEEYLILGINDISMIIGKHQSAHREVNTKFIVENEIPVIRRITGGGTVFHDAGNLNFTFISQSEAGKQVNFRKYTQPVIDFLISLDIPAKFEGKNDIKVNGMKISGNAEHVYRNRVLHHGTLLISSSIEILKNSIRKDKSCYTTRAVDSNPSSVINLNEITGLFNTPDEFSRGMMDYMRKNMPGVEEHSISPLDTEQAAVLAETKYKRWEWNYAYGPEYIFKNTFWFEDILNSCTLTVSEGLVTDCIIEGSEKIKLFGKKLTGSRHMAEDFLSILENENLDISGKEIFNFF